MFSDASKLADAYAQEMISKNKLDHYADGKSPEERYSSLPGYKNENLFQGSTLTQSDSARMALQNGLNDHSTKANINDDSATHVGIGIAVKPEADGSLYYWVQVFVADKPCDPEDKPKDPTVQEQIAPPKTEKQQAPATPPSPPPPPPAPPVQAIPVMMMPVQMVTPPPAPAPPPPKQEIPKKDQPYIPPNPAPRAKSKPVYKPVEPQIDMNPKPKIVPRTPSMPAAPTKPATPPPQPTCPCGPPANGAPNTPVSIPEPKAPANAPALSPPPSPLANAPAAAPTQPRQMQFAMMPQPAQSPAQPIVPGSMVERTIMSNNGTSPVVDAPMGSSSTPMTNPSGSQVFTPSAPIRYNAA